MPVAVRTSLTTESRSASARVTFTTNASAPRLSSCAFFSAPVAMASDVAIGRIAIRALPGPPARSTKFRTRSADWVPPPTMKSVPPARAPGILFPGPANPGGAIEAQPAAANNAAAERTRFMCWFAKPGWQNIASHYPAGFPALVLLVCYNVAELRTCQASGGLKRSLHRRFYNVANLWRSAVDSAYERRLPCRATAPPLDST